MEKIDDPSLAIIKPEEIKASLNIALSKFFKKEELNDAERELVEIYRQECIKYVSERSTKYIDIPTSFDSNAINFLRMQVETKLGIGNDDSDDDIKTIREILNGKTVVDLGSGPEPLQAMYNLFNWGAQKFVAVDVESPPDLEWIKRRQIEESSELHKNYELFDAESKERTRKKQIESAQSLSKRIDNGDIQSKKSDSLQFLMREKADGSHFIISSGAFAMGEVIPFGPKSELSRSHNMPIYYLKFLAHEIARLTPKGGLTYHCGHSNFGYDDSPLAHFLEEEGFKMIVNEHYGQDYTLWQKA